MKLAEAVGAWARGGAFEGVRLAHAALGPRRAVEAIEAERFAHDAARWAALVAEAGEAGADSAADPLVASYALSALVARGVTTDDGMARLAAAARAALGAA